MKLLSLLPRIPWHWIHEEKARVSETSDKDPRAKSGGNNPMNAPATLPKGEKPREKHE